MATIDTVVVTLQLVTRDLVEALERFGMLWSRATLTPDTEVTAHVGTTHWEPIALIAAAVGRQQLGFLTLCVHDGHAYWQGIIELDSPEPASVKIKHELDAQSGHFVRSEVREAFPNRAQRTDSYTVDAESPSGTLQ